MYGVPHRPDVSQTLEMKEHLKMIFQNYLPLSAYREFKWNKNLYLQILYAPKPFKWKSHKKKPLHICFSKETGHSTSSFSFLSKQFISDTNMAYLIAHTHPQTPPPTNNNTKQHLFRSPQPWTQFNHPQNKNQSE